MKEKCIRIIEKKKKLLWLKIITNALKKVLFSDDKNTQHVQDNICCSWIKIDLWRNFIVMILTRTGFPTK